MEGVIRAITARSPRPVAPGQGRTADEIVKTAVIAAAAFAIIGAIFVGILWIIAVRQGATVSTAAPALVALALAAAGAGCFTVAGKAVPA